MKPISVTSLFLFVTVVAHAQVQIPQKECQDVQSRIGQLLFITVDGWGPPNSDAINPEYLKLIKEINPAGILCHSGSDDYRVKRNDFIKARQMSKDPLLIASDFDQFNLSKSLAGDFEMEFGLGYGGGKIASFDEKSKLECFKQMVYLDAFFHKAIGLNQSLGPTVENNENWGWLAKSADEVNKLADPIFSAFKHFGVATTMKHFPYTPETFNLHTANKDVKISADKVNLKLENFKKQSGKADFAMTTHIFNSNVDPDDMATFSKKWVRMLREDVGFEGLVMTDALFMISSYDDAIKSMSAKWNKIEAGGISDEQSIFAARAILAGHDLVFLDGVSADTRKIHRNLSKLACLDNRLGAEFRTRVFESSVRVKKYKDKHADELKMVPDVPYSLADKAGQYYRKIKFNYNRCSKEEFDSLFAEIEKLGMAKSPAPEFGDCAGCGSGDNSENDPLNSDQKGTLYKVKEYFVPHGNQE